MPTFEEIPVIGQPGELDWYTYLYLEELQRQRERDNTPPSPPGGPPDETFAPPVVPLEPIPLVQPTVKVPISVGTGILRGVLWFLFPQPTGPREHDELDEFDVVAPPPPPPPPTTTAPDMPPNWRDILGDPDANPYNIPKTPFPDFEMPPGEPEFIVSPPKPTPRPTTPDEINLPDQIEVPDVGIDYRPGPAPTPTSTPRGDPDAPGLDEHLEPVRVPQPDRPSTAAPDLFSPTLPDDVRNPFADPFTPSPVPTPPGPKPGTPTIPDFLAPDFTPDLVPEPVLPLPQPDPFTTKDQCDCAKKKKKKKKKDRDVCYRGTYIETKKGLVKKRLEQVPCESAPRSTGSKNSTARKPKLKPGQFPGLGFLGSEHLSGGDIADLASHAFKEFAPIVMDYIKDRRKKKVAKPTKKRNRKPKTRLPTLPGTPYSTPFPF